MSRERRRYIARRDGVNLARERAARHKAVEDVARAIEKHPPAAGTPAEWAAWAMRWPRRTSLKAPDGSSWGVTTRIDYV